MPLEPQVSGQQGGQGSQPMCLTSEQLEVREGLREDPPALLLHWQWDHQQPVGQLGKVLDEVVLPVDKSRERLSHGGTGVRWGLQGTGRKFAVRTETFIQVALL